MSVLFQLGRFATISLLLAALAFSHAQADGKCPLRAKHIILFVGDGMHLQHEIAASRYLTGKDYDLSFSKFPIRAYCTTWDVTTYNRYATSLGAPAYSPTTFEPIIGYNVELGGESPYPRTGAICDNYFLTKLGGKYPATDSASAATALSAGIKTDDGNLAWKPGDPVDGAVLTIAEKARAQKGMSIGVVSTVPYSHATPAAFVSHNVSRNNYSAIADEIIRTVKPEVVIGGGHPGWKAGYMSTALYDDVKNGVISDYVFVERIAGQDGAVNLANGTTQAVATGKKLFGLFGGAGGNFEEPQPTDTPGAPSVNVNSENPTLRDATLAALKVLSKDKDGFFAMIEQGDIDWSNHANDYRDMIGTMSDLDDAVKAAVEFVNKPGDKIDWSNTLIIVTSDHSNSYMRLSPCLRLGIGDLPTQVGADYAWTYPGGEVTYGSTEHTNEPVTLKATGLHSLLFKKYIGKWFPGTDLLDNTDIYKVMMEAAGLTD